MTVTSDRRYQFDQSPAMVWAALTRVEEYRAWWPWLRGFDGTAFATGERWACEVQPPLPYRLRFVLALDHVDPVRTVTATVTGDIVGSACIELSAAGDGDGDGTELHLVSALEPSTPLLRTVTRVVEPIARFGHDWVIDTGLRQFESRAL